MKRIATVLLAMLLVFGGMACALGVGEAPDYVTLLTDMLDAFETPSDEAVDRLDADAAAMGDDLAASIARQWKETWLSPDYRLKLYGADDPAALPIAGRHAFVVLGYQLKNGEMADELKGRCEAAAAAATAFPDSILVCSGGATGENNPNGHTEAGMMKQYLSETLGIAPERIFVDERAMSTVENARNTMEILQREGIETITIVTSAYHQLRGQTLYSAMAGRYAQEQGYSVEIVGNYCFDRPVDEETWQSEPRLTVYQLGQILELPRDQVDTLRRLLESRP